MAIYYMAIHCTGLGVSPSCDVVSCRVGDSF